MIIGLYLQDYRKNTKEVFNNALSVVKNAKLDLLVFPEICYTPFRSDFYYNDILSEADKDKVRDRALEISERAGCAAIVGGEDKSGMIYSVYANAYYRDDETETEIYLKHTKANNSPLGFENYGNNVTQYFPWVLLKGKRIGMTICYDCNHAAFSRAYHKAGVDILINSTGGNVVYNKWYRYNKVRAIENDCFHFCTMGYDDNGKENSYNFGFTPQGKRMAGTPLMNGDTIGNITVYDTDNAPAGFEDDIKLNQEETPNKKGSYKLDASKIDNVLIHQTNIARNLWCLPVGKDNLVVCAVDGKDVLKPEKILSLFYYSKLKDIPNKKYLILNRWYKLDKTFYNTVLSDVLRVRSMENYCAVVLVSDCITKCYQCSDNRNSQPVAAENGIYNLDLGRMSGMEAIWKNKPYMKASWRKGYKSLIEYIEKQ